jgi:5-formyltetrahydrofolate cyclo-ligase
MQADLDKSALRRSLIAARKALSAEDKIHSDRRIMAALEVFLSTQTIQVLGVYLPLSGEPDLRPLYEALRKQNVHIALPVVLEKNQALHYALWRPGDTLMKDASGTLAPAAREGFVQPELILAPCVGFTESRYRLGYGGGYFDRTLAQAQQILALGIAYSFTCVDFAVSNHDIALNWILTEEKLI